MTDNARPMREMTLGEEIQLYEKESKKLFESENPEYEPSFATCIVYRGSRIIRKALAKIECLTAERDEAVRENKVRKSIELTPIYTCGGHGYEDDDNEDYWCPICHNHLGTHRGYEIVCAKCKQSINSDSEPLFNYRDMLNSERDWSNENELLE